uniref:Uncharacterized protein n=1 Tax=Vibrio tasmaniensis TaxID=212663 RepID=A0A0H3ZJ52_9VIBR|nr:hypothetical protein [Vibrio tasmaniensis]
MKDILLSPDVEDVLWVIYQNKGGASITLEDLEPIIDDIYNNLKGDGDFSNINLNSLTLKRKVKFLVGKLEK